MTLVVEFQTERLINPVDTIEQIAAVNDWAFDRSGDHEITISVAGNWTDYHISFTWMDDLEALHLACAFDLKVPDVRRREVVDLMARINEQLWIGHFDLWAQEGVVIFRHALPLAGTETSPRQCEALLDAAVDTCERYFQAYQFVVWAGKTAEEAIESALFETAGEA
ncbi:YbjN domain-containing protein [Microbaculum marinum]|uniref:YbjN domain-containing protein n=1 Tax=Microbaculum marinum TaxID=1764581 RepID=A0AAW9RQY9_9HYPH